jgi:hypothetical protein
MKIILKYGVAVTAVIAAWVALKHFVLHLEGPSAQFTDIAIFNFSAIVGLMMGIKEKRQVNGNKLTFGGGFLTGLGIAITYAILTSLFRFVTCPGRAEVDATGRRDELCDGLFRRLSGVCYFWRCLFGNYRVGDEEVLVLVARLLARAVEPF